MNLSVKKKRWLFIGLALFILLAGSIATLPGRTSTSTDVIQPAGQKTLQVVTPDTTQIAQQVIEASPTTAISVAATNSSRQNITTANNTALPPVPAEVAAEIRRLSNHTADGLVEERQADGSVSMNLQGHFQSVVAAVRGPNGELIVRHGEDFLANVSPATDKINNTNTNQTP